MEGGAGGRWGRKEGQEGGRGEVGRRDRKEGGEGRWGRKEGGHVSHYQIVRVESSEVCVCVCVWGGGWRLVVIHGE